VNLPEKIQTQDQLEDLLSQPTPPVIEGFGHRDGDVLLLGAGGKMGLSLACMAQRACQAAGSRRRVIAASRFSQAEKQAELEAQGIQTIRCDLLDDLAAQQLPEAGDVIYMPGMKFDSAGQEARMWVMNTGLASEVCRRFRHSRILVFSTGNVYGMVPVNSGGAKEIDAPLPVGEYAMSCLGRERVFEHFSRSLKIPLGLIRLNYACDLRYGVLVDLAGRVFNGETIDLSMGYFNTIWQGDANAIVLQAFQRLDSPPCILNVTGPELLSVREVGLELGHLMGRTVEFKGTETSTAYLSNAATACQLFGPPQVKASQLIGWVADWVQHGGRRLGLPTHFEVRDGKY
jgi:nucleoside-diphosphate-sugar epimerase